MTDISFSSVTHGKFNEYVMEAPIPPGKGNYYSVAHKLWAPLEYDARDDDWTGSLVYSGKNGQEVLTIENEDTEAELMQALREEFESDSLQQRYKRLLNGAPAVGGFNP